MKKKNLSYRKAIFIVAYRRLKGKIAYLLLKRHKHWKGWEFPKGGIDKGESELQAVKREVKEETSLKAIKIKNHYKKGKYKYKKIMRDRPGFSGQTYSLYSAEFARGKIKIDKKEHSGFKWLDYAGAFKMLTWKDQRDCLKRVNKELLNETL
jgi:8-oxo-dGTP pyrophosphatase MutT (NUDIX family)